MSTAPNPYERQANFTSFEQSSPTLPKRGTDLDAEFNAVRTLANALLSRLSEIQRDDGRLGNATVTPDSFTGESLTLIGTDIMPRGNWLTATVYNLRDLVNQSGVTYCCLTEHVAGVFATDLAAGKWQALTTSLNADDIGFSPAGGLLSTDVQAAIVELAGTVAGKQASNANLSAFAALTLAANKLLYATGAGALALADLTAFGRSITALADAAAARTLFELVKGTSAGNVVVLDGSARLPAVDGRNLTNVTPGNATVGETQMAATLNLSSKTITLPTANTPALVPSYTSAEQTISNAGTGTLTHGLGSMPKLVQLRLVCKTAEAGYSIGDEILWGTANIGNDRGVSISMSATEIAYRYVNVASPFSYPNKTTGALTTLTNANWRLVVRAWA